MIDYLTPPKFVNYDCAQLPSAQGGSILCTLVRKGDYRGREGSLSRSLSAPLISPTGDDITDDLNKIVHFERNHFSRGDIFANFMKRTERKLKNFVTYVNVQPPGTLAGVFASAKATVILNLAVERGLGA